MLDHILLALLLHFLSFPVLYFVLTFLLLSFLVDIIIPLFFPIPYHSFLFSFLFSHSFFLSSLSYSLFFYPHYLILSFFYPHYLILILILLFHFSFLIPLHYSSTSFSSFQLLDCRNIANLFRGVPRTNDLYLCLPLIINAIKDNCRCLLPPPPRYTMSYFSTSFYRFLSIHVFCFYVYHVFN